MLPARTILGAVADRRMSEKRKPEKAQPHDWTGRILTARPHVNRSMRTQPRRDGGLLATIPLRRPKYLVPPLSWLLPYSRNRRVRLDRIGTAVLDLCDGQRTVEAIIEKFAVEHKLSFRESQVPVTTFLRQLTERGLVVIVGSDEDGEE